MLDHWTLRVLVEVADQGSFSAAGETLSMTQPAVSRQIGGLERRLGVPLFRRVPRGVQLTQAGATAVELARDILARTRALEAHIASLAEVKAGQLRLSAFASANASLTPEAIRRFAQEYPDVLVSLVRPDPAGPLSAIRDGRIDLGLITSWELFPDPRAAKDDMSVRSLEGDALDGIDLRPLVDEKLLVALPADHRLAGRGRVPLRELAEERWIEGAYPDCLGPLPPLTEALGRPPHIGFVCDDWHGKQALVAAHAGVMLVPTLTQHTVRSDIVLRPTTPALPTRRLYAAVAAPPLCPPAAAAMFAILAEICARHARGTARRRKEPSAAA